MIDGDLNVSPRARTGYNLQPAKYTPFHYQSRLINSIVKPLNIFQQIDRFRAVVLQNFKEDIVINGESRVRIRARIPEIHPFPDPALYGETIPEGILALYPIFIAIQTGMPTPGVGSQIYVDFGDRFNMEDPKYYGEISKKPVDNGIMITKNIAKAKDSFFEIEDEFENFLNSFGQTAIENKEETLLSDIINIVKDLNQGDSRWGTNILGTR